MLTSDFKEFAALLNSNGVEHMVVGLDDFKTNKKAVGHYKDLADLEALENPEKP